MKDDTRVLVLEIANRIIESHQTVRQIAADIGKSSAYTHILVHNYLKQISPIKYDQVKAVFEYHKAIRHLRGGEATKIKYQRK